MWTLLIDSSENVPVKREPEAWALSRKGRRRREGKGRDGFPAPCLCVQHSSVWGIEKNAGLGGYEGQSLGAERTTLQTCFKA